MKPILAFFFLLFSINSFCQNDIPSFEFGHAIEDEFFYNFINYNVPFADLTQDKNFNKRKALGIRGIRVKYTGEPLEEIYQREPETFWNIFNSSAYYHGYSYNQHFYFDDNGFCVRKRIFPECKNFPLADSVRMTYSYREYSRSGDSTLVLDFFKDTLYSKTVYLNHIIYTSAKRPLIVVEEQDGGFITKQKGYHFTCKSYSYDSQARIISSEEKPLSFETPKLSFKYPKPNKIVVACDMPMFPDYELKRMENEITTNGAGQVLESKFYHPTIPEEYSSFTFEYDKHDNLVEVKRRVKLDADDDNTEVLYEFKHVYEKGKLIKTRAHYNFNVAENDINYSYDEQGRVVEIRKRGFSILFEYLK